ncbi:MAG: VanZ family protein [Nanoarchaeota archaeon]|nr:VanZ family protein [Nanoarchaeota archaeon]
MKNEVRNSWLKKYFWLPLIFAIFTAGYIFYSSSLVFPKGPIDPLGNIKSIAYHYISFFVLSFFIILSIVRIDKNERYYLLLALLLASAFAITDELHQFFVPNRDCGLADFLTDFAGIISAGFVYLFLFDRRT